MTSGWHRAGAGYGDHMPENPQPPPSGADPPEPTDVEPDELKRLGQREDDEADEPGR